MDTVDIAINAGIFLDVLMGIWYVTLLVLYLTGIWEIPEDRRLTTNRKSGTNYGQSS